MNERDKELAEQAGFWQEHTNTWMCTGEAIKNFATLIRADEREAIAQMFEGAPALVPFAQNDKELAKQAWTENDWDGHVDIPKLIQLVRADERDAIIDEWWSIVQADLENGVKCLNEQAATKWRKEYPSMATFGEWLEARGNT